VSGFELLEKKWEVVSNWDAGPWSGRDGGKIGRGRSEEGEDILEEA